MNAQTAVISATITAGVHRLPAGDYHADPAPLPSLSATLGKLITAKSPLHAWYASRRLNPDYVPVERKTFDIGSAAHRAVLGCGDDYVAIPAELLASNGAASTAAAKAFIADARERGLPAPAGGIRTRVRRSSRRGSAPASRRRTTSPLATSG